MHLLLKELSHYVLSVTMKMVMIQLFFFCLLTACSDGRQEHEGSIATTTKKEVLSIDTLHITESTQEKVREINEHVGLYTVVERDIAGESTEGGALTAYYDYHHLKKITATFYGETGKAITEYYFHDEKIFFVIKREYAYSQPISMRESHVISVQESLYYLNNGKMVRWKNNDNMTVDPNSDVFVREEEWLLQDIEMIMKELGEY